MRVPLTQRIKDFLWFFIRNSVGWREIDDIPLSIATDVDFKT